MKKVEIKMENIAKALQAHRDKAFDIPELIAVGKLKESPSEVYGAIKRLTEAGMVDFLKRGHTKLYRWVGQKIPRPIIGRESVSKAPDEVVVDRPKVAYGGKYEETYSSSIRLPVGCIPNIGTTEYDVEVKDGKVFGESIDVNYDVKVVPVNAFAKQLVEKHGNVFNVANLFMEKLLARSKNKTDTIGKDDMAIEWSGYLIDADSKHFNTKPNHYFNQPIVKYKVIKQ